MVGRGHVKTAVGNGVDCVGVGETWVENEHPILGFGFFFLEGENGVYLRWNFDFPWNTASVQAFCVSEVVTLQFSIF